MQSRRRAILSRLILCIPYSRSAEIFIGMQSREERKRPCPDKGGGSKNLMRCRRKRKKMEKKGERKNSMYRVGNGPLSSLLVRRRRGKEKALNFDIEKFHSFLLLLMCPPPSSPLPFPGATAASRGFREKKREKSPSFLFWGEAGVLCSRKEDKMEKEGERLF